MRSDRTLSLAFPALLLAATVLAGGCFGAGGDDGAVRLGYFPNLTHAQALYGLETGLFERELAPAYQLKATHFNAGPTALEALLTGQIDATYVGPSPTLNALASAGANVVVIVSGTASGGARFIVQPDVRLESDGDFANKRFATPQLGNTQDVSLKHYLLERGQRTHDRGGSVQVLNAANPDILALFTRGDIDGAWVPEPWATRLERDGGGVERLDERELWPDGMFVTTHLVTTRSYLERHPDAVAALLRAHVEATLKVQEGGPHVLEAINDGIAAATGQRLGDELLASAFEKVNFTYDPLADSLYAFADQAHDLGLLQGSVPRASQVYRLGPLNEVLAERQLPPVDPP